MDGNSYLDRAIDVHDAAGEFEPRGDLRAALLTQAQALATIAIAIELEKLNEQIAGMTEMVAPSVNAGEDGNAGDDVLGKALRVAYYE